MEQVAEDATPCIVIDALSGLHARYPRRHTRGDGIFG